MQHLKWIGFEYIDVNINKSLFLIHPSDTFANPDTFANHNEQTRPYGIIDSDNDQLSIEIS